MKLFRWNVILLAMVLAGMTVVPCVSAGESGEKIVDTQTAVINQLIRQNMTVGEYYEKTSPEFLMEMPEALREHLYQTKKEWPTPLNEQSNKQSNNSQSVIQSTRVEIQVLCQSGWGLAGNIVSYGSESESAPTGTRFPTMYDKSTLFKWNWDSSQWEYVTSTSRTSYLTSYNRAASTTTAQPGTYIVFGEHHGTYPPFSEPPGYSLATESSIFEVS